MNLIQTTFLILFVSNSTTAQDTTRKAYIAIHLGTNFSIGDFGSTAISNSSAGYAKNGHLLDITFGYKTHPHLGFTVVWRGQVNYMDVGAYAQNMADYIAVGNPPGSVAVSVKSSAYTLGGIMAGVYGSYLLSPMVHFEPRVLLGFSSAKLPSMTTETYYMGNIMTTFIQEEANTSTFSYIIGAGLSIDLSKRSYLLLNMDYYAAKAKWEDVKVIGIGHVTQTTEIRQYTITQDFGTINLLAGLGYRF